MAHVSRILSVFILLLFASTSGAKAKAPVAVNCFAQKVSDFARGEIPAGFRKDPRFKFLTTADIRVAIDEDLSPTEYIKIKKRRFISADLSSSVERRPKMVNGNNRGQRTPDGVQVKTSIDESADPARPTVIHDAEGNPVTVVTASGEWAFQLPNNDVNQFLRGGLKNRKRVRNTFYYADGAEMKGPYHTGSLPWDSYLVEFPDGKGGTVLRGYAGTMEQPYKPKSAESPQQPGSSKLQKIKFPILPSFAMGKKAQLRLFSNHLLLISGVARVS